ncbi:MAG: type IIL restriction-modification enzyme MmeI, partial [Brevundimonas sp.]|uniref:type IIL restriction-modification enzyme MmeI n=1 Tax=Brevundimonas sp. TaxID=1871086 RepID=UPI00391B1CE7
MDLNDFIDRWSARRGGAERANYQMFLTELCEALELPRPDPASDDNRSNDYVFERGVKRRESEGVASTTRIDLYKRGCFILEAKQSRASQRDDGGAQPSFFKPEDGASLASAEGKWDTLMRNARRQAEDYVFRLPPDHPAPPFIRGCDDASGMTQTLGFPLPYTSVVNGRWALAEVAWLPLVGNA